MTVIIGILCSDGVVIGSDSAMAAGRASTGYTIEWQDGGALKIEIVPPDIITAVTGAFGLAQRFNAQIESITAQLRQPFHPPQLLPGFGLIGTPLQKILAATVQPNSIPYDVLEPVDLATIVSQLIIAEFQRTQSPFQNANGWGLGALVAFVRNDIPYLIDFDSTQFHPELKGMPDPERGNQDRVWRCVSMGRGQQWADAFLAFAYTALFGKEVPTVSRAKLAVVWAIKHVINVNTGLVGGATRLAVLEKIDGAWKAHHEEAGQSLEQLAELETYIANFRRAQQPDKAAESAIDLNAELAKEKR